jgi:hypothetical protein
MTSDTENLVLEHLRHIRADLTALRNDSGEVKSRLHAVEWGEYARAG